MWNSSSSPDADLRNPASPDALNSPISWEARASTSVTHTVSSSTASTRTMSQEQGSSFRHSPTSTIPSSPPPVTTSPTRTRSTPDLLSAQEKSKRRDSPERKLSNARSIPSFAGSSNINSSSINSLVSGRDANLNILENGHIDRPVTKEKEP